MTIINGVDFGDLVLVNVGGVKAYIDDFYRKHIPTAELVPTHGEPLPVYTKLRVSVMEPKEFWFYPTSREDAIKLARGLALNYPLVKVEASSRALVSFKGGVEGKHYTLADYYDGITTDELEETRLE